MEEKTVGFAMCGSFCTHARAMAALEQVRARWRNVVPIVSECTAATDTRFGNAHDLMREMERICDHRVIATMKAAEPIGPQKLLDLLILCPCTGNTLGKLAAGVTDSSVTMAAKAHLRNGRLLFCNMCLIFIIYCICLTSLLKCCRYLLHQDFYQSLVVCLLIWFLLEV